MKTLDASVVQSGHLPGLALGIVHGDQVVHLHGFGRADPSGRQVTPHTPFILGSTTKSLTALAVMQLVESGKLALDDPVQRYLPWFHLADAQTSARITVRNLLNDTSSIPRSAGADWLQGSGQETLEQRIHELSTVSPTEPIGTYQYANANYSMLGLLIEKASGLSYPEYMQRYVFAPLQMNNSFGTLTEARRHGLATGYRFFYGLPSPADLTYPPALLPAGWLTSSAEDISHFLIAQLNGGRYGRTSVLSAAGIAELQRPIAPADVDIKGTRYAMGWYAGVFNGSPVLLHNGDAPTWHSFFALLPREQWGFVLLVNANSIVFTSLTANTLTTAIATMLLGLQPPDPGMSLTMTYALIDSCMLLVLALQLFVLMRLNHWGKELVRFQSRPLLVLGRVMLPVAFPLVLALWLLFWLPQLFGSTWGALLFFQPDITSWMLIVIALLLLTGGTKAILAVLTWRSSITGRVFTPMPDVT